MKTQDTGHRWTTEDLKTLMRLWSDETDIDDIARTFNVTRFAVSKIITRLRKQGIPLPRRAKGHKAGRKNQPWTQAEVEYLLRRRKEGATAEDIASDLDRSFMGVQGMVQKLRVENVPIQMRGNGVRRLWSPESLTEFAAGHNVMPFKKEAA